MAPGLVGLFDVADVPSAQGSKNVKLDLQDSEKNPEPLGARQANHIAELVSAKLRLVINANLLSKAPMDAEWLVDRLAKSIANDKGTASMMRESIKGLGLTDQEQSILASLMEKSTSDLSRYDVLTASDALMSRVTNKSGEDLTNLKLQLMGLSVK